MPEIPEKEMLQNQMMKFLENCNYQPEGRIYGFEATLSVLKFLDKELEDKQYTEVHPSRYELVKLIEKAEALL